MSALPPGSTAATITLSLISHTNVGKTTLARTLLRQDIGEVADRAHVTQFAEMHVLIETEGGERLRLADTPGFGDSARLLKRLRLAGNPIGWLLTQVWDRYTDRAFWGTQQAVRNVREEADLVLYLVSAAEDPMAAGYVAPEMEILGWIGKPVVVLLNQLGPPRARERDARDESLWRSHLARYAWVRDVLPFDAFARCWVQEDTLLGRVEPWLAPSSREAFARLRAAWRSRNLQTFAASIETLVESLVETALDHEPVIKRGWTDKTRAIVASVVKGGDGAREDDAAAVDALARRLDARLRSATDKLIRLHGLSGKAAAEVLARMQGQVDLSLPADVGKAGLVGGLVSGALGGLAADLAAGGITLGAGALIGGLLGALGSGGAARALNLARGLETGTARWSGAFLSGRVESALLRYLAVAHFGRGRGDYVESEYPAHWRGLVAEVLRPYADALGESWLLTARANASNDMRDSIGLIVTEAARAVLVRLYPEAEVLLADSSETPLSQAEGLGWGKR
jgi:hypothetical protein